MASITLSGGSIVQSFPEATSVGAFERKAKIPGGAPVGAAIVSAAVTAGVLTLSHANLVLGGLYTAYALVGGRHLYVDFAISKSDVAVRRENGNVGMKVVQLSVDLPSVGAGAAVDHNVAVPAGTCKAGDLVVGAFFPALNAGLHIQGLGCVATDSIRIRVTNDTAGALDAAAADVTFLIVKV